MTSPAVPPLQIVVSLVNGRPGAMNFSYSPLLRDFTKATNIRLRFLRTNTLLGHLMGKALRDPTVTRRVSLGMWLSAEGRVAELVSHGGPGEGLVGAACPWQGPVRVTSDTHGLHCSTITASKTSASAAAVSVMATRMSVTLRTPRILSGETFGSLSSLIYLPAVTALASQWHLRWLLPWVSIFPSEEPVLCDPLGVSWSWVAICPEFHRGVGF